METNRVWRSNVFGKHNQDHDCKQVLNQQSGCIQESVRRDQRPNFSSSVFRTQTHNSVLRSQSEKHKCSQAHWASCESHLAWETLHNPDYSWFAPTQQGTLASSDQKMCLNIRRQLRLTGAAHTILCPVMIKTNKYGGLRPEDGGRPSLNGLTGWLNPQRSGQKPHKQLHDDKDQTLNLQLDKT